MRDPGFEVTGAPWSDGDGGLLLEREQEVSALAGALRAARRGTGSLVLADGPAGIGKSRLLAGACASAREAGMSVLAARGIELEREIPFAVATQLFAARLRDASAAERARLSSGHAELALPLFEPSRGGAGDFQGIVRGLYWLTVNLTLGGAGEVDPRPLLIAIDDAQWCDPPSLAFLSSLVSRVEDLPLAVVVATRGGDVPGQAAPLEWLRDHPARRILRPARLSDAAIGLMVAGELPAPEPAFVEACARVSGGNPFLARELVRALRADGIAPTGASVPAVERLVPDSVLQSVLVRLARLPTSEQRLAAACAVLGDSASLRHAAALAELERTQAESAADALAAAHVLAPGEPLRFAHPLIATAVHADLPAFARARAHRRAADLLGADAASADVVAAHLLLSTPEADGATVALLRLAAARALARGGAHASVRLLERALAEPPAADQRAEVLLELAVAAIHAGDLEADRHLAEALAAGPEPEVRARTLVALARLRFQQGAHAESARLFHDVVDSLGSGHPIAQEVVADEVLAGTFRASLRVRADERMVPLLRAARAGRPTDHPGLLAQVVLRLALGGGAPDRIRSLAERAAGQDPLVDPASHGMLAGILVQALVCVDELAAAERIADAALEAARRRGSLLAYASASYHRAIPRYHRGALTDALADLDQALTAAREGWGGAEGWIGALQADAHLDRGDLAAAREAIVLASSAPPDSLDEPIMRAARARLALADLDPASASRDALEAGRHLVDGFGIDHPGFVAWRDTAAMAAAALGDADQAQVLARDGLERARRCGIPRAIGLALRTSGLVAAGEPRLELLAQAVAALEGSPSRLALVRALVDHGSELRRAGQRLAAREPLRRALQLADGMGAAPLAESARQALLATGSRPRRAAYSGADALTPTERRVAELAAAGLTNPQIAQALFVTLKTIQTHLTHAYRKLEIDSRLRLAEALEGRTAG